MCIDMEHPQEPVLGVNSRVLQLQWFGHGLTNHTQIFRTTIWIEPFSQPGWPGRVSWTA